MSPTSTLDIPANRPALERRPLPSGIPAEQKGSLLLGIGTHLGPALCFVGMLAVVGRTVPTVVATLVVLALLHLAVLRTLEIRQPSATLPTATRAETLRGLTLVFGTGLGLGTAVVLAIWAALVLVSGREMTGGWTTIGLAVLATDAAYYCVHRFLNHSRGRHPVLRAFRRAHGTHHGVEHLDFLRGNVSSALDTAVTGFQVPLGMIGFALGLDLPSLLTAYGLVLMLQATHHVNHTLWLGPLRFFFMDNHAHKLHHCPRGFLVNHGALFAVWDLLGGTYYEEWRLSANALHARKTPLPISWKRS